MLIIYRRHNPKRCRFKTRAEFRCKCPIWVSGTKDGIRIREALKLRDWTRAQELVRKWEVDGDRPKIKPRTTIEEWKDQFIQDAEKGRHLSEGTLRLYRLLFRQLIDFAGQKGIRFLNDLDLNMLTEFRSTWSVNPLTATKKLERLRSVFKFAVQRKMADENYANSLASPKVKPNPTLPFSKNEMDRILKAADSDEMEPRLKAFILTMRYSGFRISDVATLSANSLKGNRLKLYQAKTGEPVSVLLPKEAVQALTAIPRKSEWFFWTGQSKVTTTTGFWRSWLAEIFKLAKIEDGHSHRFRDTFAVALLESGASLESVSILLGHQNIRVTQKHYNPWVKSRQKVLDQAVRRAIDD